MVKLDKIYTRGGDNGKTSLGNGERVSKCDLRVSSYGTVDELNSAIGVVMCYADSEVLKSVQNSLFDLGADLAVPQNNQDAKPRIRIKPEHTAALEHEIDSINENLAPLTSFILPGGNKAAAYLHLARTICRRAEREVIALAEKESVNEEAIKYLNRLSDLLFVMARKYAGSHEILWKPTI